MNKPWKCALAVIACVLIGASSGIPCGAPPENTPPPPPPNPPVVCCVVVDWYPHPTNPAREVIILRYFRQDGRPLYQSNPMPLAPDQACLCSVPALPSSATAAGAVITGLSFGSDAVCRSLPRDVPGYGPFQLVDPQTVLGSQLHAQVNQYYQAYASAAGDLTPPPAPFPNSLWTFTGPGNIPVDSFFDVFVQVDLPMGFSPRQLAVPGQMWAISLYLVNLSPTVQVLSEPIHPGLPPVPISQFVTNPGASAFYKFKYYPLIIPGPCPCPTIPPTCPGDLNGDLLVNGADLSVLLATFGSSCR